MLMETLCKCGCGRLAAKNRKISNTCKSKLYREQNPLRCIYLFKKGDAKKRGLEFTLTFSHFYKIAIATNLLEHRGRAGDSLTLERSNNELGYTDNNFEIISKSENTKRYWENYRKLNELESYPF